MTQPKNAFEIFQLLEKSNCGNCGEKTCLAFAGAVFKGRRRLNECPRLDRSVIDRFSGDPGLANAPEAESLAQFEKLKADAAAMDLPAAAQRIGARFSGEKLTLKVLGKDFGIDSRGNLYADIHVNPWVAIPFLTYILYGKGQAPSGRWVSFRELKDGRERYPLFHKRYEELLKEVGDSYTPLFDDMVHLFGGKQVERQFASDISVVLHPLPRVPIMVCYWLPAEGMQSSLNVFFDDVAKNGYNALGQKYTVAYISGGIFSLDGGHPSCRGAGIVAKLVGDRSNVRASWLAAGAREMVRAYPFGPGVRDRTGSVAG